MIKLLLFGGTSEGRALCEHLLTMPVDLTVSVATPYGLESLRACPGDYQVLVERLDKAAMRALMRREGYDLVVDATHPYAVEATENIRLASEQEERLYLRLLRGESLNDDFCYYPSVAAAAEGLCQTAGSVLLTTGSKELKAYTVVPDYAQRLFPRVLPSVEAIRHCEDLGFLHSHIIAMQGPFSLELNQALIRQYDIRVLVTKDGGSPGGFNEKVEAARTTGTNLFIVGRPAQESGLSLQAVLAEIKRLLEVRGCK